MGQPMRKKTPCYTPAPAIAPEVAPRVQAVLKVVSGQWTVTEAAAEIGMSRLRFQTLMHRSLEAMVSELAQKAPGRPSVPTRERELESENARLRRENEKLQGRVGTIDRLLGVASDMLKGRIETSGRQARTSSSSTSTSGTPSKKGSNDPEDPGGEAGHKLDGAEEMRELGVNPRLAAAVVGVSPSTVRRWVAARRCGQPLRRRCGPARTVPDAALVSKAVELVRDMHGLVGAASLGRSTGLSRRQAAAVKHAEQTAMERERQAACTRVVVTTPGIVRGFDQMYVWTQEGWRFPLVSADAAVPYRTSIVVADAYDEDAVLEALRRDLATGGAPLVWRRDRHRAHRTDSIVRLLDEHGVIVLQGPPHYPRFLRPTRAPRTATTGPGWIASASCLPAALQSECDRMRAAVNERWRRRALGWRTPAEAWALRPCIARELRDSFRAEVYDRGHSNRTASGP